MKKLRMLLNRFVKSIFRRGMSFVYSHPEFRQNSLAIIRRLGLYSVVHAIYSRLNISSHQAGAKGPYRFAPSTTSGLTPRAFRIYVRLKSLSERQQGKNS
jgi:hypothetical protein